MPTTTQVNPDNFMPELDQSPVDGQKTVLSTERELSTIPRANTWVYPSSQQFHQALVRKGMETPEEAVDMMVAIHNFLNEGCWQEVLKWEKLHMDECREPKLLRLRGRPNDLSPKARFLSWFGTPRPFDRHDWVVSRCGREVRYVIDYYSGQGQPDVPEFHVDVRPALDSPQAVYDRMRVALQEGYQWVSSPGKPDRS
ncbi:cytochrome c/c1 heme-lyase [Dimargaris cristalligena]|uniref:Holocytochrome c-type synthase n=1 Tax=Dimargaris cristalligena TaxID=215637 RepID=A0A4P9ZVZ8_9FUNG|nr:cytochrome c/c1 heme-lyase [Dimargaris cristalligena]|eukprot:RKP37777.1 cytochrome c/c1 heme-lyase [Dimargaris cristalligena]